MVVFWCGARACFAFRHIIQSGGGCLPKPFFLSRALLLMVHGHVWDSKGGEASVTVFEGHVPAECILAVLHIGNELRGHIDQPGVIIIFIRLESMG